MARRRGGELDEDSPPNSAALWERVRAQGSDLTALAEATQSRFRDIQDTMASNQAATSAAIEKVAAKLDASQVAATERSKPQYLALFAGIISAIGVSVTIIQWQESQRDKPVDEKLSALTVAIGDLTKNTAASFGEAARNTVGRTEFAQVLDFRKQIQDLTQGFRDKQQEATAARIDRVQESVVPRDEFKVRWEAEEKRDSQIEGELNNLTRRLDLLAPAGDYLRALGERQHELELKVYGAH